MTREELLSKLREIAGDDGDSTGDLEGNHMAADAALIEYIADAEIKDAYESIEKWYA